LRRDLKTCTGRNTATANREKQVGRQDVNQLSSVAPFVGVGKTLSEDIARLTIGLLIQQSNLFCRELFMEPID
jgi:hypothetical protein